MIIDHVGTIMTRRAVPDDIPNMVALSHTKRRSYEQAQPQFWRYAGPGALYASEWYVQHF